MDGWADEFPLTQKEALEFADRLKQKVTKYPQKNAFDCYQETKLEMGFTEKQAVFMDIIMASFFRWIDNQEESNGKVNRTRSTKPKTP